MAPLSLSLAARLHQHEYSTQCKTIETGRERISNDSEAFPIRNFQLGSQVNKPATFRRPLTVGLAVPGVRFPKRVTDC